MTKVFKFNPLEQKFRDDPYPIYDYLRTKEPVHQNIFGNWTITRYQDIKTVLNNPSFQNKDLPKSLEQKNKYFQGEGKNINALASSIPKWLFYLEPPDHSRMRRLVSKAFTPRVVEELRPQIQATANELIDVVENRGSMDIMSEYASPLPIITISKLLGIPLDNSSKVHHWAAEIVHVMSDRLLSQQAYEKINQAFVEFNQYLREIISEKTSNPQQDLISELIRTSYQTEKLNEEELLATCIQLFGAGEETTVNLLGNGMLTLLRHPEAMEQLKQSPEIIPSAVEEILRYESPVQQIRRVAIEDTVLGGKKIKAGEYVELYLGAANRDPEQFLNPNQLNLTRPDNHHLAFADGIHHCLGAPLARVQAQIAINTIFHRLPNLQLQTNKLEWIENIAFRGLKTLPVIFEKQK